MGGILLCNDSHGDATLAKFDEDFEFIGIVDRKNKRQRDNLENYFTLPRNKTDGSAENFVYSPKAR